MAALERDALALNTDIGASVAALRTQAEATTWTGANRLHQDQLLATFETDVLAIQTSVEAMLTDAHGIVAGALNPTIEGLRADVEVAGADAGAAAESFAAGVNRQRHSFDLVLNGAR
jgi:hypothetical protein